MAPSVYGNAPIKEAVFDTHIKFESPIDQAVISKFVETLKKEYPKSEVIRRGEFSFEFKVGEKNNFDSKSEEYGIKVTSKDGSKMVQFRKDGFTFSKLKPYDEWATFNSEAQSLLGQYLKKINKSYFIERIALRYINVFGIPFEKFKIEDYFETFPTISPKIPQNLINFFMRSIIKTEDTDCVAIINQTVEDSKNEGITNIILDIDVFRDRLKITLDSKEFKDILQGVKDFRTTVFEGSITDKARDLIK